MQIGNAQFPPHDVTDSNEMFWEIMICIFGSWDCPFLFWGRFEDKTLTFIWCSAQGKHQLLYEFEEVKYYIEKISNVNYLHVISMWMFLISKANKKKFLSRFQAWLCHGSCIAEAEQGWFKFPGAQWSLLLFTKLSFFEIP